MSLEERIELTDDELEDLRKQVEEGEVVFPEGFDFCVECGHLKIQSTSGTEWFCFKCKKGW
jgi:ribosomal protein L37AE/L43A